MPYQWSPDTPTAQKLTLWPYQSLQPQGFVWFIGVTSLMLLLPLISVMGTVVLWGLLPFIALAVAGVWFAIHRNRRSARIVEVLTLTEQQVHLVRHNPDGEEQEWACNRYWAHPTLHPQNGPVPNYVTLKGGGREVEIGAFLSEEERISLYDDLRRELRGS
jgi:uncharacterized membrane protein